jgi:tRNA-dependent cyclodipeptide synthase
MTSLTMTRVIGTTIDNIREKKHGIFVGISLGSKFFTEHNIREYILWACKHSLRSVVVLIADKPHAVNYELRNGYNPKRALAVVLRKGDELAKTIGSVMESLPEASRRRVNVLRWQNVEILDG